jgi:hypothetical protein
MEHLKSSSFISTGMKKNIMDNLKSLSLTNLNAQVSLLEKELSQIQKVRCPLHQKLLFK